MNLFFDWSIDNAVLMLQLSFFFSVMSFIMCLILFYKRHKDEVSRRIPTHHPFDENGEIVGQATTEPEYDSVVTQGKPTSTPYYIVIKNTTNEIKKCRLFGLGDYLFTKNFGSDEGIEVSMGTTTTNYLFMLLQSAFNPFEIGLTRLASKNLKQLEEIITITSKDANGQMCQIPLITANYVRADGIGTVVDEEGKELSDNDDRYIDVHFPIRVDMSTNLEFSILPNTELRFATYPVSKFNPSRVLSRFMGSAREYSKPIIKN